MTSRDRARVLVGIVVTLAIVGTLGVLWSRSRMPSSYDVMDMGQMSYGGGPRTSHGMHEVSVKDLDTPGDRKADVVVDLTTRQGTVQLADGRRVDGFSVNGTSPGPTIEARVGQLVEVRVHNEDVTDGVAIHWHGVDVPNAEDGVAGVTQNAIGPGKSQTYRWIAAHAGTFWYHSHQVSHQQVAGGLLGAIVIRPARAGAAERDVLATAHLYEGTETINGRAGFTPVAADPGQSVRVRIVNTDNGPQAVWATTAYRVLSVDGYDVHQPGEVTGRSYLVPAGGRVDLGLTVPRTGAARVIYSGDTGLLIGRGTTAPTPAEPQERLDLLAYGTPEKLPFDAGHVDRRFVYDIGRKLGFVHGKPGLQWSVNGRLWPRLPSFVVREGDVVHVRISNHSGEVHPMHLHGHHAVVLSRNGVRATGSPWWFDSLDVKDGDSFEVVFLADNPGIWMDHCHNLKHASQGLITHLMYEGVTTPYRLGSGTGNEPE